MIPKSGGKSPCAGTSCELHQAFPCSLSSCLHVQTCSPEFYISGLITTSPSHRLLRVLSGSSFHAQPSHTGLDLSKCSLSSVDLQIFISFSSLFFPQNKVSVPSFITHMCLLYSMQAMCGGGGVQPLSCVWLFATPWLLAHQAPLSSNVSQSFSNSCQ